MYAKVLARGIKLDAHPVPGSTPSALPAGRPRAPRQREVLPPSQGAAQADAWKGGPEVRSGDLVLGKCTSLCRQDTRQGGRADTTPCPHRAPHQLGHSCHNLSA